MQTSASKILVIAFFLGALALLLGAYAEPPIVVERKTSFKKPSVLIIMIDSLRADRMGIYGYKKSTTPFLDSLFEKGVRFEYGFTPAYLTFQSDAAVLSNQYPSRNGVTRWDTPLYDDVLLLPKTFSLYGYQTAAFVSPSLYSYFGFAKQFDEYRESPKKDNIAERVPEILDWIASSTDPYFIFWHIYDVHQPFVRASKDFYPDEYEGPFKRPKSTAVWSAQRGREVGLINPPIGTSPVYSLTDEDIAFLQASYDTGIRAVDTELKNFFEKLTRIADLENTIVVISSEHGEDMMEHGSFFHRDVYNVNTRVPYLILYPARLRPAVFSYPVSTLTIGPTVQSLAAIEPMAGAATTLLPNLRSKSAPSQNIFIERHPFNEYALIQWPWKFIKRSASTTPVDYGDARSKNFFYPLRLADTAMGDELYNLVQDSGERKSVIGQYPEIAARMRAVIGQHEEGARFKPHHIEETKVLVPYP